MKNIAHRSKHFVGFTIVELVVVVSIIGILASFVVLSYNNWQQQVSKTQLQSDLTALAAAMKNNLNFNNTYPVALPATFSKSADVTIIGSGSSNGKSYCYSATSSKSPGVSYMVTSLKPKPRLGECIMVTAISDMSGTPYIIYDSEGDWEYTPYGGEITVSQGETITAGISTTPAAATIEYQWQSKLISGGVYENIIGATSTTYTPNVSDINKNIRVVAIGTGDYYGDAPSNPTGNVIAWFDGVGGLPSSTKVFYKDVAISAWATSQPQDCVSPQCNANALVSDNNVDFSEYPARQACKVIGGRLPTYAELGEIYNSRAFYGSFRPHNYLSSMAIDRFEAYMVNFAGGSAFFKGKSTAYNVRCVKS